MLQRRTVSILRCFCQNNATSTSTMSTLTRDGAMEDGAHLETEKEMIFPWHRHEFPVLSFEEAATRDSLWRNSLSLLRNQISLEIIRHFLSHPSMETMSSTCGINYMDPRGGEFLTGARQAFTVCCNSIFKPKVNAHADNAMIDSVESSRYEAANTDAGEEDDTTEQMEEENRVFDASGKPVPRSHPASKSEFQRKIESVAERFYSFVHGSRRSNTVRKSEVSRPIEYINAWDKFKQPPSTRFMLPSLSEVLDSRLATFFEEALQSVSNKYSLHHVLHQVYMPSISRCEIIFNAQRGFNFDLIKRHYIFGVIGAAVLGDPPQKSANGHGFTERSSKTDQIPNYMHRFFEGEKPEEVSPPTFTLNSRELSEWLELPHVQRAKSELKKMTHLATIRVHVNLPCKETFFVSEKESGLIVQGECIPRDSTHQIVLEGSFSVKEMNFPEFQVVDIDNWLGGNRFV